MDHKRPAAQPILGQSHVVEVTYATRSVDGFDGHDAGRELLKRICSALFYAVSSFLIVVINKMVLTNYRFPSYHFLGLGQMVATIVILSTCKGLKIVTYPSWSRDVSVKIFPLPLIYVGNLICGLGATQSLSLPMFTVLRRFTILMTCLLEYAILKVRQSNAVIMTIVAMVGGAVVAATDDLTFDLHGYCLVLGNDAFTAINGVYMKKKLNSRELGKYGLLYYNSLFMIVPLLLLTWYSGDFNRVYQFNRWRDFGFITCFLLSSFMGFVLMYSTVLCTSYNSALTTTIVGSLKNILITYVGMYVGGDYIFSVANFVGLNISMIGSVTYSYITLMEPKALVREGSQEKEPLVSASN